MVRTRWIIVCLTENINDDFIERVKQLDAAMDDDYKADVAIFHGDYPTSRLTQQLRNISPRKVELYRADDFIWSFPDHFDPYMEDPNISKRTKWGYQQVRSLFPSLLKNVEPGRTTSTNRHF